MTSAADRSKSLQYRPLVRCAALPQIRTLAPGGTVAKSPAKRRPKRPARVSVPVTAEDYDYLVTLVARTGLKMSAVNRLLLHRAIEEHRHDGHLA